MRKEIISLRLIRNHGRKEKVGERWREMKTALSPSGNWHETVTAL